MAGTGPDSGGQYAHEKPTKTENVVGAPKAALPRPELIVSTQFDDADGGVVLGKSRALLTAADPRGGGRVLLAVEGLSPVQVELFTLMARAPQLVRLLARVVDGRDREALHDARLVLAQLPFEVTS